MKKNKIVIILVIICLLIISSGGILIYKNKKNLKINNSSPSEDQAKKIKQQEADYLRQRAIEGQKKVEGCLALEKEKIDSCIYDLANKYNNESWCDKMTDEKKKSACHELFTFGKIITDNKDPKECLGLSAEFKNNCLSNFFINYTDLSPCNEFQDDDKNLCSDIVNGNIAYKDADKNHCLNIKNQNLKKDCLEAIASKPEDSDQDGLTNDLERAYGTDPFKIDTDGDGLSDSDEINKYKTNPRKADTDADGYSDNEEIQKNFNPNGPGKL